MTTNIASNRYWVITLTFLIFLSSDAWSAQSEEGVLTTPQSPDQAAVVSVLKQYKDAIQNLTVDGTFALFTQDSAIFEQGGVEGSYPHYVEHHLGPELGHFESFTFSNYDIRVEIADSHAFATETYHYKIILKPDEEGHRREVAKKGLATSVLRKGPQGWKIHKTHSSSRALKK